MLSEMVLCHVIKQLQCTACAGTWAVEHGTSWWLASGLALGSWWKQTALLSLVIIVCGLHIPDWLCLSMGSRNWGSWTRKRAGSLSMGHSNHVCLSGHLSPSHLSPQFSEEQNKIPGKQQNLLGFWSVCFRWSVFFVTVFASKARKRTFSSWSNYE